MEYSGNIKVEYIGALNQERHYINIDSNFLETLQEMSELIDIETDRLWNEDDLNRGE